MPNDARLIGGAGIGVDVETPDSNEWNSVLLCTGANACGKVRHPLSILYITSLSDLTERIFETS